MRIPTASPDTTFLKGTDFRNIPEKEVALIVKKLNNRPGKCLELPDALRGVRPGFSIVS